jgi:hypothetical protein
MWMTTLAWASPVTIEAESPGVVRVRASSAPVFVPACGGVGWERFDENTGKFVALPTPPCGPLKPAIVVGSDGLQATLSATLPGAGMHVVRAVVVFSEKCTENKPFPLADCSELAHVFGPNQVVRRD